MTHSTIIDYMTRFIIHTSIVASLFVAPLFAQDFTNGDEPIASVLGSDETVGETPQVQASVTSSTKGYEAGEPVDVILTVQFPKGYHAYYSNPGCVGMPMTAELVAPTGFKLSPIVWSAPHKLTSEVGVAYGYEFAAVRFTITPQPEAPAQATFTVKVMWQMCRDGACLMPEDKDLVITLPQMPAPDARPEAQKIISEHFSTPKWAVPAQFGFTQIALIPNNPGQIEVTLQTAAPLPNADDFTFICDDGSILPTAPQQIKNSAPNTYRITLTRNDGKDMLYPYEGAVEGEPLPVLSALGGFITIGHESAPVGMLEQTAPSDGTPTTIATAPVQPIATVPQADDASMSVLTLAGLLFLGGLILNLMPCVFPVIGLKVLSFVQLGGGERRKVFFYSLAFVIGVVLSFWAITLIVLVIKTVGIMGLQGGEIMPTLYALLWKTSGETITWSFWMQNSWIIYALILLFITLGLSMYGVFEIGVSATTAGNELQQKSGFAGAFWSGVLATVVATPCSGPFLGAAMGPALALPGIWMLVVFTAMGLGMSLPYIILGLFPSLVKYLPRPGAWMESFKQALSFFLFAAAAWLIASYIYHFEDPPALITMLVGLVVFSCGWWVYGRWCPMYRTKSARSIGLIVALLIGAAGFWMGSPIKEDSPTKLTWIPWTQASMDKALAEGTPVYVDFTATWCMTCQLNKKVAYTQDVIDAFHKHRVIAMKADKTKPNPSIDKAMSAIGRSAVPTNALYLPGKTPAVTDELLSPTYLLDFLDLHFK